MRHPVTSFLARLLGYMQHFSSVTRLHATLLLGYSVTCYYRCIVDDHLSLLYWHCGHCNHTHLCLSGHRSTHREKRRQRTLQGPFYLLLSLFIITLHQTIACDVKSWSALNYGKVKWSLITHDFYWQISRPVSPIA